MKDQQSLTSSTEPKHEEPKPVAPESYTFKVSEGRELDAKVVERATPIFKELGLTQDSAQKLVDFYNDLSKEQGDIATKAVRTMREGWVAEINKDPEMGGKLEQIKTDIGRMKSTLFDGDPKAMQDFNAAMDLTGAGDNPHIVKAWWKLAQMMTEGQHVSGSGPSKHGQAAPGSRTLPSAAQAMYPNLPTTVR